MIVLIYKCVSVTRSCHCMISSRRACVVVDNASLTQNTKIAGGGVPFQQRGTGAELMNINQHLLNIDQILTENDYTIPKCVF